MGNIFAICPHKTHNKCIEDKKTSKSNANVSAPTENLSGSEGRSQNTFSTSTSGNPAILVVKSTSETSKCEELDGPHSKVNKDHKNKTTFQSISSTSISEKTKIMPAKSSEGVKYDELDGPQSGNSEVFKNQKQPTMLSPRTSKMIEDVIDTGEYADTKSVERKLRLQIKEMKLKAEEVEITCNETAYKKSVKRKGDHLCPEKFLRSMQNIEEFITDLKHEIIKINDEKREYMNRLSHLAGAKLRDNNPNITDLQDPRRPINIAEEYKKLYDDQWTDAMEGLEKILHQSASTHEKCVHHLFSVIKAVYKSCKQRSELQLQALAEHTFLMNNPSAEQIDAMLSENPTQRQNIVDNRKQSAVFAIEMLQQTMIDDGAFKTEIERCRPHLDDQMLVFLLKGSYFTKCIEVCWYMVIQDPPMYLETRSLNGTDLNKDTHMEYVTSGNKVQYDVWPTLYQYLQNNGRKGPLMVKGVVQVAN